MIVKTEKDCEIKSKLPFLYLSLQELGVIGEWSPIGLY